MSLGYPWKIKNKNPAFLTCWTQVDKMWHSSFKTLSKLLFSNSPNHMPFHFTYELLKMKKIVQFFISRHTIFRFSIRSLSLLLKLGILQSKSTESWILHRSNKHCDLLAQMWLRTVPVPRIQWRTDWLIYLVYIAKPIQMWHRMLQI